MLIDFQKILDVLPAKPERVLHVGAERGAEYETYKQFGLEYFFVEASPFVYEKLIQRVPEQFCINLAVTSEADNQIELFQVFSKDRSNLGCSSILKPTGILDNQYLEQVDSVVVETTTIDLLDDLYGSFDFLNMDIQGAELLALTGANYLLRSSQLKGILIEFNTTSYYEGDCQLNQLDDYLAKYNFKRVITEYAGDGSLPWGDALWIKNTDNE